MAMFNCYVSSPEGICCCSQNVLGLHIGLCLRCSSLIHDHHVLTQAPNAMVNQRPSGFASPPTWVFLAIGGPQRSTGFPYAPMHFEINHYHITFICGTPKCASQINADQRGYCDPNSHGWMMLDVNADLLNKWTIALGGAHILSQSHPLAIS